MRLADDYDTGPPQPIPLVGGKVTPTAAATAACSAHGGDQQLVERVMQGTGCDDKAAVLLALKEANGNTDEVLCPQMPLYNACMRIVTAQHGVLPSSMAETDISRLLSYFHVWFLPLAGH